MINIFDDRTVAVPESGFSSDWRFLNRLHLLAACVFQKGYCRLQSINLDRQSCCLEGGPFLGRSRDNQHRKFGTRNSRQFQIGFGISKTHTDLAGHKSSVKGNRLIDCLVVNEDACKGLKDHQLRPGRGDAILCRAKLYAISLITSTAVALSGAVPVIIATPAHAIIVFDPSNYAQNVIQAARALQQITNQITSLQNEAQMLINQAKNLASLPYSSLQQLQQSVQRTQQLLSQAQNIAYDVKQIDQAFQTKYGNVALSATDRQLVQDARSRWQNTVGGLQDAMRVQATVVGNIDTNRTQMSALVGASQSATGALQATQAGNQLLALQAQQLADLTAVVAANGRAQALSDAEHAAAAEQGREQRRRFLTPGAGYQPGNARMFQNSGN